jgi:signal transduction histidine kinase
MARPNLVQDHLPPSERSSEAQIRDARFRLKDHDVALQILEGFPGLAVILDQNRQIVAFNKKALRFIKDFEPEEIYGKRLGEALRCTHSLDVEEGCGASRYCLECGNAKTLQRTRETSFAQVGECSISALIQGKEEALNLRVFTSPLVIDDEPFTLFTIKDIAQEQRLQALERIFFHDVLNTAAAINSLALLLDHDQEKADQEELIGLLRTSAEQLIHEIHAQRDLVTAERGELAVSLETTTAKKIIDAVLKLYVHHDLTRDRKLMVDHCKNHVVFETAPTHLIRCIGNLVKNALEASHPGDEVRIGCESSNNDVTFTIHNKGVMPESVQLQVFQRSFSTKARLGRGIGTYSVKLLVEQYLEGEVWFESNEEKGTVFYIRLSKKFLRK